MLDTSQFEEGAVNALGDFRIGERLRRRFRVNMSRRFASLVGAAGQMARRRVIGERTRVSITICKSVKCDHWHHRFERVSSLPVHPQSPSSHCLHYGNASFGSHRDS